jgi:hypothetical protein
MLAIAALICAGGCRKKQEPAKLIITVEGQEFSDAIISIDGTQIGHLTQTLIKTDGELYIDGVLTTTLPPPEDEEEARQEDEYTGAMDSIILSPGDHTIDLTTPEGKNLLIKVSIKSGFHQLTYLSEENTIKWDDKSFTAGAGESITIR